MGPSQEKNYLLTHWSCEVSLPALTLESNQLVIAYGLLIMAPSQEEVFRAIDKMYDRVQEETYYDLLGVQQDADKALVSSRFRQLAKNWHIDRFSKFELGERKEKVQQIFSTLNTAHQTLTDEDKRLEYEMEISDGPDIGELLQAENDFMRGKSLLESGRAEAARKMFDRAVELAPDEMQYKSYAIYTEYLSLPKDEDGHVKKIARKRAQEIYSSLDKVSREYSEKDWLLQFMGSVSLGLGQEAQASELFREALMINKNNTAAARQLRLLRMRRKKRKKSGGFFAKLFGK